MNAKLTAADWTADRGEKWRAQSAGMEAMLKPVDEPLIRALHLEGPYRIADIGCGGGGTALDILGRAPAGTLVHGFDVSPALIELARSRASSEQSAVTFHVADVATANAPEALFQRLVSRFGIMFFDDPAAAFSNLIRWLAPGGRFASAVWGRPDENPWFTTVRDAVAEVIDLPRPDPDAPGPFRYRDASKLLSVLDETGYGGLNVTDWRGMLPIGGATTPAAAANYAIAAFSSFGELLSAAGDEAVAHGRRLLTERFSRNEQNGTVLLDACVHIVTGVRPAV